jgi:two-component system cell cycle sensor histidine kinase/response regulator CckA
MKNRKTIIGTTTWMAATVALAVMFFLPLSYFAFSYQYLKGSLESEAEINSRLITDMINANPLLWRFEQMRLEEALAKRPDNGERETRRLVDLKGEVIAESAGPLPLPLIKASNEVLDAGLAVGRIEISRSLLPLFLRTSLIAFVGLLIGLSIYITLRVLPIGAVIKAENALREAGDFLSRIMQSTTNAIVVVDPNGLVSHLNQRCVTISGYQQEELLGHPFSLLFQADEYSAVREQFDNIMQQRASILDLETHWRHRNGGLIPISWGGAPLTRQGNVAGMVFTAEDISKRKQAQEEKDGLIKELQSALAEIKTLRGIIPICSYCKNIRSEEGLWSQLEAYIHDHSGAQFSHGICPECYEKLAVGLDTTKST